MMLQIIARARINNAYAPIMRAATSVTAMRLRSTDGQLLGESIAMRERTDMRADAGRL